MRARVWPAWQRHGSHSLLEVVRLILADTEMNANPFQVRDLVVGDHTVFAGTLELALVGVSANGDLLLEAGRDEAQRGSAIMAMPVIMMQVPKILPSGVIGVMSP